MASAPAIYDFTKFAGIKNAQDRSQIGTSYLASAQNCDIDDNGVISRRGGFGDALISGEFRDGWTSRDMKISLAVKNETDLVAVNPDGTVKTLRTDLIPGLPMAYADINDKAYYTNSQVIGVVDKKTSSLTSFPSIKKTLSSPMPAGHLIEYYNGHLLVARGNVIYASVAMDFGRTESRKRFFPFPGIITLMKAVRDGVWVSYGPTVFLSGVTPSQFNVVEACDYGAIPYTGVYVDSALLTGSASQGDAVMWESEKGTCIGFAGGRFTNVALQTYNPQPATAGTAVIRKNRRGAYQYLALTHNT